MFTGIYSNSTDLEMLSLDDALAIGFALLCRYRRDHRADPETFRTWLATHSRLPLASALRALLLAAQVDALYDEVGTLDGISTAQALDAMDLSGDDELDEDAAFALLRAAPLPSAVGEVRA